MHTPLPRMLLSICRVGDCCDLSEPVHAGGVHEICKNPDTILSSLLMLTCLDLLGSSCCLMRIAHRSSCVHLRPLLCQSAVRTHTIVVFARASQFHLQSTIVAVPQIARVYTAKRGEGREYVTTGLCTPDRQTSDHRNLCVRARTGRQLEHIVWTVSRFPAQTTQ